MWLKILIQCVSLLSKWNVGYSSGTAAVVRVYALLSSTVISTNEIEEKQCITKERSQLYSKPCLIQVPLNLWPGRKNVSSYLCVFYWGGCMIISDYSRIGTKWPGLRPALQRWPYAIDYMQIEGLSAQSPITITKLNFAIKNTILFKLRTGNASGNVWPKLTCIFCSKWTSN